MNRKTCTKCGVEKPADAQHFHKRKQGVLKLTSHCRECRRQAYKGWSSKNPDKVKKRNRDHYHDNREYHRAREAKRRSDKPKMRAQRAKWEEGYEKRTGMSWSQVTWKRRSSKIENVLLNRIRVRVLSGLRGGRKNGRLEGALGYSMETLRRHLERQFKRGMSWDNLGKWHIDHIQPASSFNYKSTDDPEFKACWALTNLRPLWKIKNLEKKDKRLFLI